MRVGIIGAGAYALALAHVFNKNNDVIIYTKVESEFLELKNSRTNTKFLPDYVLDDGISVTNNLSDISYSDLIIFVLPIKYTEDVVKEMKYLNNKYICIATKGINNGLFTYDFVKKYIKSKNVAVISVPSFASDILNDCPIGLTLASPNKKTIRIIKDSLHGTNIVLEETNDVYGVEVCGALKNIYAIGSGILDGLGSLESTRAMYLVNVINELKKICDDTIISYAGIGDVLLTCNSLSSRNFTFGYKIGKKEDIDVYVSNTTIEGLETLKNIPDSFKSMKIINIIYKIVLEKEDPNILLHFLFD